VIADHAGRVVSGYVVTNSSSSSWQLIGTANPQWPQVSTTAISFTAAALHQVGLIASNFSQY